jgi:predicted nucleic acid-binding protein
MQPASARPVVVRPRRSPAIKKPDRRGRNRSVRGLPHFRLCECGARDLSAAWRHFAQPGLHKLSAVDATNFVLMEREGIRVAFAFDHHFASAGFRLVG